MEQEIAFNKNRSLKSCIADSWKLAAIGWHKYLKALWLPTMVLAFFGALTLEVFVHYATQQLLPAYRLYGMKADPALIEQVLLPDTTHAAGLLLAFLLLLISCYTYTSRLMCLMHHYRVHNELPQLLPLRPNRQSIHFAMRSASSDALFFVSTLLLVLLIAFASLKWSLWISLLLPFLLIYAIVTANVAQLEYAFYGKALPLALKQAFKRSMGFSFLIQFITFIPTAILWTLFTLPAITYVLSRLAAADSELMGDMALMPAYLPYLFVAINTLCLALCVLSNSVRTWAMALKQVTWK